MTLPCDRRSDEDHVADINEHLDPEEGLGVFVAIFWCLLFWCAVVLVVLA